MTVGISTVNLANAWLNVLGGTTFTGVATPFIQLHTGDPGASGTANVSQYTTRVALTWSAASTGSKALAATLPSWTLASLSSPTTETITHMSVWSAASAGTFYYSFAVTNKAVSNGDVLNLTAHSISVSPLAA